MTAIPLTGASGLTPFPIQMPLETFARAFWGTYQWGFSGDLTYRTTDGVSWSAWLVYNFTAVLDTLTVSRYFGNEHLMVGDPQNSSVDFYFGNTGDMTATLRWGDPLYGPPHIQWDGNHGAASGNVVPGLRIHGSFSNTALGTAAAVDYDTGDNQSGFLNADVGTITAFGTTIRVFVNSQSDVSVAGNTEIQSLVATLQPYRYLEFRDSDGNNPVWNTVTGTQLIDPRTT